MSWDAQQVMWHRTHIKDVEGYFTLFRISWESIPKGFNRYEIGKTCAKQTYCFYQPKENSVEVDNFLGVFITKSKLPENGIISESTEDDIYIMDEKISFGEVLMEMDVIA